MLIFLVPLIRTKLPQLSRYLGMFLATRHDPSASFTAGYKKPRPPQATSCYQPPSTDPQDRGHKIVPLSPRPRLHLPALEEAKLVMSPHLALYTNVAPLRTSHNPQKVHR